jgi:glutamyl/glutaminyl-tRNA synthetase
MGDFPKVSHVGLIMKDGKKLSKRDADVSSLLWYRQQGYKPAAILNFILLLGWSLKIPRGDISGLQKIANDFISKEAAIELFPKGTLKNSPCNYSLDKLNAINKRIT